MRYRPFANTRMAVSSLSLALDGATEERSAADWRDLVHGAFEEGVNAFEIRRPSAALMSGFAEGVSAVRRSLIFIGLRIDDDIEGPNLDHWVEAMIAAGGLGEVNLLTVSAANRPLAELRPAMQRLKQRRLALNLGVAAEGEALDPHIGAGFFDAIVTQFNLLAGWRERHRLRVALERQMGVIVSNPCPPELAPLVEQGRAASKGGFFKRAQPLAGAGSYAFLAVTPGWSAEQICLAYALTEPAVATVQMEVGARKHLAQLAEATARALPSAVSAQIEMARFSVHKGDDETPARRRA